LTESSAFACPIVTAPASTSPWISRGSFEQAEVVRDRRAVHADALADLLLRRARIRRGRGSATASSDRLRSRRWTFSTSATSSRSRGSISSTTLELTQVRPVLTRASAARRRRARSGRPRAAPRRLQHAVDADRLGERVERAGSKTRRG
jgi:hypothetical protein